jgi:ribosomal protein S12 methylthiotransferase
VARGASAVGIYFVSLGCPKNRVDTEVMLGLTRAAGHRLVDRPEEAEVIVVNTCGFIDSAKEESVDTILELAEHKRGRCRRLIVTGCLVQRYGDELVREMPEIDWLLGASDFPAIVDAIGAERGGVRVSAHPSYLYDHHTPRVVSGSPHSVFVKVAEGCDRPCAFCVIPQLRGPQRSRTVASVVAEVEAVVAAGAREINLIAQDLTRYGADLPAPRPDLSDLLVAVAAAADGAWVRVHYAYPTAVDDRLIETVAGLPAVIPYLDLPVQHIDDEVLKRMRRGYTGDRVRQLVDRLRRRIDGLVLRTTFLVGHPGESEPAFERLCDFVAAAEIERVGVFAFSREDGTVAALLPDRVPVAVAAERRDRLMALQQPISLRKNRALIGRELEVLVDGAVDDVAAPAGADAAPLLLLGRWYGQAPEIDGCVYLGAGEARAGDRVRAVVRDAAEYDLVADPIEPGAA